MHRLPHHPQPQTIRRSHPAYPNELIHTPPSLLPSAEVFDAEHKKRTDAAYKGLTKTLLPSKIELRRLHEATCISSTS